LIAAGSASGTDMMESVTVDDGLPAVKRYYDEVLNKDKTLVITTNDEPTPLSCVEEMVAKIPEALWMDGNVKILDPCCGCGNFPVVVYFKLLRYHTKSHILENMLHFNDTNTDRLSVLADMFGHPLNVHNEDFLGFDHGIRFDLVMANPPYAKLQADGSRASKNHNLIGAFIRKSLEILKPGGLLLYITPDNWMSLADRNTLIGELTRMQIVHIDIHTAKKYFKHIGSSFVWYLIENRPSYKDVSVAGTWKGRLYADTVGSEERSYIPLFYDRTVQSILHKTLDLDGATRFKVETSSDLHRYTKRSLITNDEDASHRHRLVHTPKQTVWASRAHKYQEGYKVFISTTSYYGTFVDNCGMTQSIAFIRCRDKAEADNVSKVLGHPVYEFVNNICRYGNFNNIRVLQRFPSCDSYDAVYETFGITAEEAEFIERNR